MNKHFDFNWQFNDFEIRIVHEDWRDPDTPVYKDCPIELIRYFTSEHAHCYTVAYWRLNDEGYALQFVGDRPFTDITADDMSTIWPQLCAAQKMLDTYYEACEANKDGDE